MTDKPTSDDEVYSLVGGARGMEALSGAAIKRARALPIWSGAVEPALLSGGLSNINLTAEDAGERYVIRVGEDEPFFGVSRAYELQAFRAAHAAGVAPEVVYAEPGLMVIRFIEGRSLLPADVHGVGVHPERGEVGRVDADRIDGLQGKSVAAGIEPRELQRQRVQAREQHVQLVVHRRDRQRRRHLVLAQHGDVAWREPGRLLPAGGGERRHGDEREHAAAACARGA